MPEKYWTMVAALCSSYIKMATGILEKELWSFA